MDALGTLLLLPYLSDFKQGKGIIFRVITYISLISYSMYLINLSIVRVWILSNVNFGDMNITMVMIIKYILFWFITIILSIIIYKYFEIPMTKIRDRINFSKLPFYKT